MSTYISTYTRLDCVEGERGVETGRLKPELSTDLGEFWVDSVENSGVSWG